MGIIKMNVKKLTNTIANQKKNYYNEKMKI